jgi:Fe2+ transport system protein B
MSQIKQHASENVCKLLIGKLIKSLILKGNKSDISERQVTFDQGKALAETYGIPFFEASAKEGTNIAEAFTSIAKSIKDRLQNENTLNPATTTGN